MLRRSLAQCRDELCERRAGKEVEQQASPTSSAMQGPSTAAAPSNPASLHLQVHLHTALLPGTWD